MDEERYPYSNNVVIYQELDECLSQKEKIFQQPVIHVDDKRYFSPKKNLRNGPEQRKPLPSEPDMMYSVEKLEGKGLGIVAARELQPGELLLEEAPLILVPITEEGDLLGTWVEGEFHCHQLERELARIGEDQRRAFHQLQDSHSHTITGFVGSPMEEAAPPLKTSSPLLSHLATAGSEMSLDLSDAALKEYQESMPLLEDSERIMKASVPASDKLETALVNSESMMAEYCKKTTSLEEAEQALKDTEPWLKESALAKVNLFPMSNPNENKHEIPSATNGNKTNLSDLAQTDYKTNKIQTSHLIKSSSKECYKTECILHDDIEDKKVTCNNKHKESNTTGMNVHKTVDDVKPLQDTCTNHAKTNYGILKTNSITITSKNQIFLGLFLRISRLNHSCQPNGHHYWSKRTGKMAVRIVKKVTKGGEITISYMSPLTRDNFHDRSSRRTVLLREFGFCCQCIICTGPGDRRQEDARRLIREVESKWAGLGGDPAQAVKLSRQQLDAMTRLNYQVGLLSYSILHCLEAISLFMHKTKVESVALQREGLGYARRGLSYSKIAYGADSEETAIFQRLASIWENSCDSSTLLSNVQTCILALREIDL